MSDHAWTEVWESGQMRWVHVDPSEKRIDDPEMYERDWKKTLREVYAFENGVKVDVTESYKIRKHASG
jgi:transglutaminase-like putative cysteine protease